MPQCIRRTAYGIRANTCACVTGRQTLCPGEKNLPDGFMTEMRFGNNRSKIKFRKTRTIQSHPLFWGYIRRRLKTTLICDVRPWGLVRGPVSRPLWLSTTPLNLPSLAPHHPIKSAISPPPWPLRHKSRLKSAIARTRPSASLAPYNATPHP